ncbi:MAG: hypothetical protein ABI273_17260 [Lacunisphaera sp.]
MSKLDLIFTFRSVPNAGQGNHLRPRPWFLGAIIAGLLGLLLAGCSSQLSPNGEEQELVAISISSHAAPHPTPKNLFLEVYSFQDYAGTKNEDRTKDRKVASGRLNNEGIYWISLPKQTARYLRFSVSGAGGEDGSWRGVVDVDRSTGKSLDPIKISVEWHSDVEGVEIFQVPH